MDSTTSTTTQQQGPLASQERIPLFVLLLAVMGSVAFTSGLHNVLSHPELALSFTWAPLVMGAGFCAVAGILLYAIYASPSHKPGGKEQ